MKKSLIAAALLCASALGQAAVVDFSYNTTDGPIYRWGFDKKETYNIAIQLKDPSLVGMKVIGMHVEVDLNKSAANPDGTTQFGQCEAFLTTELARENKLNVANICTENATLDRDTEILSCTFSEPYTITEEGVFVGYTLPVESLGTTACKPVAVVPGNNDKGLWVYATRSVLSWTNKSEAQKAVSAMVVVLEGDVAANAAGLNFDAASFTIKSGSDALIPATVSNIGSTPVSSVEYSYTIGSLSGTGSKEFTPAISTQYGATADINLPVTMPSTDGSYTLTAQITKVNGAAYSGTPATTSIKCVPTVMNNRPLVEEYTGTWCGYCPRGFVAMETMAEAHPGQFIGIAYHNADPMATIQSTMYPSNIDGYPNGAINRGTVMDPGYFTSQWSKYADKPINSNVETVIEWADADRTQLKATTTVVFAEDIQNAGYRVGCALVGDGFHGPTDTTNPTYNNWGQSNYYNNDASVANDPGYEPFYKKGATVYGLTFNDVLINFKTMLGVGNIIPSSIKAYEPYVYEETFDLTEMKNLYGWGIFEHTTLMVQALDEKGKPMKDPETGETIMVPYDLGPVMADSKLLRVVGVLFNGNGTPVNSCSSAHIGSPYKNGEVEGSIQELSTINHKPSTTVYDLQGRRISTPAPGQIYIQSGRKFRL